MFFLTSELSHVNRPIWTSLPARDAPAAAGHSVLVPKVLFLSKKIDTRHSFCRVHSSDSFPRQGLRVSATMDRQQQRIVNLRDEIGLILEQVRTSKDDEHRNQLLASVRSLQTRINAIIGEGTDPRVGVRYQDLTP